MYQLHFYQIYHLAARSRNYSMAGPLPIPAVDTVERYCSLFKITSVNQRDRILKWVTFLDDVYLTHWNEKNEKQKASQKTK